MRRGRQRWRTCSKSWPGTMRRSVPCWRSRERPDRGHRCRRRPADAAQDDDEELTIEAAKHADVERTYRGRPYESMFPAVTRSPTGPRQQLEAGQLLAELDRLDAADPGFEDLLRRFIQVGRAHFDFEERQIWPRMRAVLPAKVASDLGQTDTAGPDGGPVLPHPRAWASRNPQNAEPAELVNPQILTLRDLQCAFSYLSGSWCSLEAGGTGRISAWAVRPRATERAQPKA